MKKLVLTMTFIIGTALLYGQVNNPVEDDSESYGDGAGILGEANSFFGHKTGRENTGAYNCFFGKYAGISNSGKSNVFIGVQTGMENKGHENTFIGFSNGEKNIDGYQNTYLGAFAGYENKDGYGNVFIGYKAGYNEFNNNRLYIDNTDTDKPLIFGNFYKDLLTFHATVGIGTTNYYDGGERYALSVAGKVRAEEVKVYTGWADFVFEDNYNLPTLVEVEAHIDEFGHLKDIPSAKEVENNGIDLGEINKLLLQKIEELTLYTIEQEKRLKALEDLIIKKQ